MWSERKINMGNLFRAITTDGVVRAFAIDSTNIVETARAIHNTSPTASAALGRTLTAASMMGIMLKSETDSVTLKINGGGIGGTVLTVSDYTGNVRGYIQNPSAEVPLNSRGKLDVAGIVGTDGFVTVIKDLSMREPYVGQTPIVSGEIAEDITQYFVTSEQTPTVCALGVLIDRDCTVKRAGGYIIQPLPLITDEEITRIETNVSSIESVTAMLEKGLTPMDMLTRVLDGFEVELLDEYDASYKCRCSREKVERALVSLGKKDLAEMVAENKPIETGCQFCDKKYTFTSDQIYKLLQRALKK